LILPSSFLGLLLSRALFGLGFGSISLSSIIYTSEITSAELRARSIFSFQAFTTLGMLIFSILCLTRNFDFILRSTGIMSALFSVISLALGYFTMKTSHIFMLRNNSSLSSAFQRFQYFQQDRAENIVEFETTHAYIIKEVNRKYNFLGIHNISAMSDIFLIKIGYLSIFNALHNSYRSLFLSVFLSLDDINFSEFAMMLSRFLGCVIGFILLDHISKRMQFLISSSSIAILLFIFGSIFISNQLQLIWLPLVFFLPVEFFLGFGTSSLDEILKSEVFSFKEKPLSIATTMVVEQCVHIIFIILFYSWVLSLGSIPRMMTFMFGAITLLCGFALFFLLRDSRRQSLVQVSNLYSNK
jgi:MFS family permease